MIHAYHVIFGAYGFWLPNDPRGSWSDFVGAWELARFGKSTMSIERKELTPQQERERQHAKRNLKYPPVQFTGIQARAIGAATKQLTKEKIHPLAGHADADGKVPTPWASRGWKVYLDTEAAIECAIRYTQGNPEKEDKPPQKWSCVTPFGGLATGWVTYHV